MCNEMEQNFTLMLPGGIHTAHLKEYEILERQTELRILFLKQAAALDVFVKENSIYFSSDVIAVVKDLTNFAFATFQGIVSGNVIVNPNVEFENRLKAVGDAFRNLLAAEAT